MASSFSAGVDELLASRRAGYRALACVPLRARGRVIGVMELLSTEARPELESRPSLAEAIAAQIAIVIQNARLLSDILRHSMRLEGELETSSIEALRRERLLHALADTLAQARRSNDTKQTAVDVLERCLEPLAMDAGTVHLVDAGTRALQLRAQKGLPQAALDLLGRRLSGTVIGRALETAEPVFVAVEPDEALDATGCTGCWRLPAVTNGRSASGSGRRWRCSGISSVSWSRTPGSSSRRPAPPRGTCRRSSCRRRRWNRSERWPAGSRTSSTTSWGRSWAMPATSRR